MAPITRELIRKKSEHNERTMDELEEISLHQLEIERIEVIGTLCRKLKILYLQNNIISKIENLHHLKDLTYLNLALNNIQAIEGLESCEFLQKLDLTVNFIDLDTLEASIQALKANHHLTELYMVGNPAADWEGFKDYVVASLPKLIRLDGCQITKSMRIRAAQRFQRLKEELCELAKRKTEENRVKGLLSEEAKVMQAVGDEDGRDTEEPAPYTPELRTEMYREMAEEKAEKEAREKERMPRERDFEREHHEAVAAAREKTHFEDGRVRQCNEGKLQFRIEEDAKAMYLYVQLPRFMDTSLIECDVHPTYITVVAKNKTLRLAMPVTGVCLAQLSEEFKRFCSRNCTLIPHYVTVQADNSSCQRSSTTGELKVTMPKVETSTVLMQSSPQLLPNPQPKPKLKRAPKATRQQEILGKAHVPVGYLHSCVFDKRTFSTL